jgi:hypothetical protein
MAIEITNLKEVEVGIKVELERVHSLTIRSLTYLGELCLIEARDRPQSVSWIDHTGNLRSSIGYVVVYDGKIVKKGGFTDRGLSFENGEVGSIGKDGKLEGKQLAESLAAMYTGGYSLIVVAGMNYASYVEDMDNKVVLASAELLARTMIHKLMAKLKMQIENK